MSLTPYIRHVVVAEVSGPSANPKKGLRKPNFADPNATSILAALPPSRGKIARAEDFRGLAHSHLQLRPGR